MRISGLTSREKNLIIIALTALFFTLFITYLFIPLWDKYSVLKAQRDLTTSTFAKLEIEGNNSKNLDDNIDKLKDKIAKLYKQVPPSPESANLLFALNKAAEQVGVELAGFEAKPENNQSTGYDTNLKILNSKVKLIGSYNNIIKFLNETEKLTRITHNQVIIINEIKDQNNLEAIIEFKTFFAISKNKDIKIDSEIPKATVGRQTPFKF